jgi:hypothetical protein
MISRDELERIASAMPAPLRRLRVRLLLEDLSESIGMGDVPCPGCRGSGWADAVRLQLCPLCGGFERVPLSVAEWFRSCCKRGASVARRVPVYHSATQRAVEMLKPPRGERLGRMAFEPTRLHMPSVGERD